MGDDVLDYGATDTGGFSDVLFGGLDRVLAYERLRNDRELQQKPLAGDLRPYMVKPTGGVVPVGYSSAGGVPPWVFYVAGAVGVVGLLLFALKKA